MAGLLESLGNLFGGPGYCPAPPSDGPIENEDLLPPPLVAPGPDLPEVDLGPDAPPIADGGAQTEADAQDRVRDEPCVEGCPNCVAVQNGSYFPRSYSPSNRTQRVGYAYQHFVVPWFAHNPAAGQIQEWQFSGVRFDGLDFGACHLLEAKYGHDNWFIEDFSSGGRPVPREFPGRVLLPKIFVEAQSHVSIVRPHYPEVRLTWVFSSLVFKIFMTEYFLIREQMPPVETEHRPYA